MTLTVEANLRHIIGESQT